MKGFTIHVPELYEISELNPAAYNPRKISVEKFEALKENIRTEGFLEAIIVQKDGLRIIGGHQRVRAVKELSLEMSIAPPKLPCIVLDIDDKRAKKLNIKLNSLKGEFEAKMLGELLIDIYESPKNAVLEETHALGFSHDEVIEHMRLIDPSISSLTSDSTDSGGTAFARSVTLSIEFESVRTRDRIKKLLTQRTKLEKKKTGEIVAGLLEPTKRAKKKTAA